VQRSSILYKACSATIGVPTTLKNDILAIALTNHLVQMTLHWSSSRGGYNPSRAFKIQEKRVFENILSHNNIPSSIKKPILLVRRHLQFIYNSSIAILPCVINILKHIEEEWNGVLLQEFKDWIIFYEKGTKTDALLFHAAFDKSLTLLWTLTYGMHSGAGGGLMLRAQTNAPGRHLPGWIRHILSKQMMPLGL
jgi:hypothetical protein